MKTCFWNVRGLPKNNAVDRLRHTSAANNFDIICITEPMIKAVATSVTSLGLRVQ